jgi:hypothetical protein
MEWRIKTHPTFSVSVVLWLHSDVYIWVPFFWIHRTLRVKFWESSGTLAKNKIP